MRYLTSHATPKTKQLLQQIKMLLKKGFNKIEN